MDQEKKQNYIELKTQLGNIRQKVESLNKDYVTITSYLENGIKIDNKLLEKEKWDMIGNQQKQVLTEINQEVLPFIEKMIS